MSGDTKYSEMKHEKTGELNSQKVHNGYLLSNEDPSDEMNECLNKSVQIEDENPPDVKSDEEETEMNKLIKAECEHILSILPAEVWCLVADELDDPRDLENLCNCAIPFRNILAPKWVSILLPSVLKILEKTHCFLNSGEKRKKHRSSQPQIGLKLDFLDLLSYYHDDVVKPPAPRVTSFKHLRLVSRSWCAAVDRFYQNHDDHRMIRGKVSSMNKSMQVYFKSKTGPDNMLTKFSRHFEGTHSSSKRNPFFGRSVSFTVSFEETKSAITETVNQFESLLSLYGHHIWYFSFVNLFVNSGSEVYSILQRMLTMMPNLKLLNVTCGGLLSKYNTEDKENCLKANINSRPLPTLEKLEILEMRKIHSLMFQELIRSNGHVNTLVVYQNFSKEYLRYPKRSSGYVFNTAMPQNLKELCLNVNTKQEFDIFLEATSNSALTKLYLDFKKLDYLEWDTIFSLLKENWRNTLQNLELIIPTGRTSKDKLTSYEAIRSLQLTFPALKVNVQFVEEYGFVDSY